MVTLYLLARLIFRQRNSLNAIGFAAVCLLALDPRSLAGASFQMTLLSVLIVAGSRFLWPSTPSAPTCRRRGTWA